MKVQVKGIWTIKVCLMIEMSWVSFVFMGALGFAVRWVNFLKESFRLALLSMSYRALRQVGKRFVVSLS
jgi:hypothetical protein